MKHTVFFMLCAVSMASFAQSPLDQIKGMAKDSAKVQVTLKEKKNEAKKGQPPMKTDRYLFKTPGNSVGVNYTYFLNQPPDFNGKFPAVTGSNGIGLDGKSFINWYYGGMIHIYLNNTFDVLTTKPAKVTTVGGKNGNIEFVWDFKKNSKVTMQLVIPPEGNRVYARISFDVPPEDMKVNSIKITLVSYPGGFGPAYKLPSHRAFLLSDGNTGEIKPGEKQVLRGIIPNEDPWMFTYDKLQKKGSLGLLLEKNAQSKYEYALGSYGTSYTLTYPGATKTVNLGFYAFETINDSAMQNFKKRIGSDRTEMTAIKYGE